MNDFAFSYDVILSYHADDKKFVRPLAVRLQADGLRVWFDEWEVRTGDNYMVEVENGLEHSRVLVLCVSAKAYASDWRRLEAGTTRFRDPLLSERRLVLLRIDDSPTKESLAQFLQIDWYSSGRERAYATLLEACQPLEKSQTTSLSSPEQIATGTLRLQHKSKVYAYAMDSERNLIITGGHDKSVRIWDSNGRCIRVFKGHTGTVWTVAWSPNHDRILSGGDDGALRLWDVTTRFCLRVFRGHTSQVMRIVWGPNHTHALSASLDRTIRMWDLETGECTRVFRGHTDGVWSVAWSNDQKYFISASSDRTLRVWDVESGRCLRVLEGHSDWILSLAPSRSKQHVLSGSRDHTVRLWDIRTGECVRIFVGHTDEISGIAWTEGEESFVSASSDGSMRLWSISTGKCLGAIPGESDLPFHSIYIRSDNVISGNINGMISVKNFVEFQAPTMDDAKQVSSPSAPAQVQYTNAKVLLVGESGAGKTGLSKVLAGEQWHPTDSTVGTWATQWKLPVFSDGGVEREIWLWDFGGQADQRLIHQLYMDETALAILVFDGQKEDLFETIGQWDRDLTRAASKKLAKLLVAGRVDAGGVRFSRHQLQALARERGFIEPVWETSARLGTNCEELRQAILYNIDWDSIPWRTSPLLFKQLKEGMIHLRDSGHALMRVSELRSALRSQSDELDFRFADEELRAVVGLLAGPGIVWELKFGTWVLLQPEYVNAYAQAVIQTMRTDEYERGCIQEERVLSGHLSYQSSIARLEPENERIVLLAMHQTLVERGLCLREHTEKGTLLIFPSYYRRERPELKGHPAVLVSYRFNGSLDEIYATLVVRLHHTESFDQDELWRYAADFTSLSQQRRLGVKLTRRAEGAGELEVYFDPEIPVEEKMIFSKYVHEHLLDRADEVVRLRHYVCPNCGTPVRDRELAMERLTEKGKQARIVCQKCEKRVPLWDELEERFAAPEVQQRVRELEEQAQIALDNESKERVLVGEVISTVALAGQICREFTVSDHGIDMEIEFKSDSGEATGRKVYLQLKSGDSYLRERKTDGAEIFLINNERHARYWAEQAFPVLLVIRNSEGEVRWMEVRGYLRRESEGGRKTVKHIVFEGERFDVMSVRRWREVVLDISSLELF